jgi:hypothetical protein
MKSTYEKHLFPDPLPREYPRYVSIHFLQSSFSRAFVCFVFMSHVHFCIPFIQTLPKHYSVL